MENDTYAGKLNLSVFGHLPVKRWGYQKAKKTTYFLIRARLQWIFAL
jgi:hypothetical protein